MHSTQLDAPACNRNIQPNQTHQSFGVGRDKLGATNAMHRNMRSSRLQGELLKQVGHMTTATSAHVHSTQPSWNRVATEPICRCPRCVVYATNAVAIHTSSTISRYFQHQTWALKRGSSVQPTATCTTETKPTEDAARLQCHHRPQYVLNVI